MIGRLFDRMRPRANAGPDIPETVGDVARPNVAAADVPLPDQYDWLHRPRPWRQQLKLDPSNLITSPFALGNRTKLFHDGDPESLRLAGTGQDQPGLSLSTDGFEGQFVSVVQDFPDAGLKGLGRDHIVSMHVTLHSDIEIPVYGRLNVKHGPNLAQMVREVALSDGAGVAEFDLAYSTIKTRRVEAAWLDVILNVTEHGQWTLEDLVLVRAPRADV